MRVVWSGAGTRRAVRTAAGVVPCTAVCQRRMLSARSSQEGRQSWFAGHRIGREAAILGALAAGTALFVVGLQARKQTVPSDVYKLCEAAHEAAWQRFETRRAIKLYQEALQLLERHGGDDFHRFEVLLRLGILWSNAGQYSKAVESLHNVRTRYTCL